MAQDQPITCVVADDHPAVVELLGRYLEEHGIRVVGRAGDGSTALNEIREHRPAVVLLDVQMPGPKGVDVAREATRVCPESAIVFYTAHGDRALLLEALDAGARGYLQKEAPLDEIVRAIRMVSNGQTYVDPGLAATLTRSRPGERELSPRQRDILRLLADGCSNEEIGRRLYISPETVRTHVRAAMKKLGASTRTEAVAKAVRESLIP